MSALSEVVDDDFQKELLEKVVISKKEQLKGLYLLYTKEIEALLVLIE
jgi:hypothetical protein